MNLHIGKFFDRYVGIPLCGILYLFIHAWEVLLQRKEAVPVRHILLIKLWGIGNLVLLLPALEALRRRYPDAKITFLTLKPNRELIEDHPCLDQVITISISHFPAFLLSSVRALFAVRSKKNDLLLDFEQFCRFSSLFSLLSGAKQRIGFHNPRQARGFLYTVQIPYNNNQHMKDSFFEIARAGGAEKRENHWPPSLAYLDSRGSFPLSLLEKKAPHQPLVGIHPGSGDNFIGRRWPLENFRQLSKVLIEEMNAFVIFTGTRRERKLVEKIAEGLPDAWADASGLLSLPELFALITRCDLFISNDTAPVHIASAVGTPLLAFYGPNTPTLYGPIHEEGWAFYKKLPCSPCLTNLNAKTSFCRIPICIQEISVEEVLQLVRKILEKNEAGREKPFPQSMQDSKHG